MYKTIKQGNFEKYEVGLPSDANLERVTFKHWLGGIKWYTNQMPAKLTYINSNMSECPNHGFESIPVLAVKQLWALRPTMNFSFISNKYALKERGCLSFKNPLWNKKNHCKICVCPEPSVLESYFSCFKSAAN